MRPRVQGREPARPEEGVGARPGHREAGLCSRPICGDQRGACISLLRNGPWSRDSGLLCSPSAVG